MRLTGRLSAHKFFMSKIFLAYRFTGENPLELEKVLSEIKNNLECAGHEVVCTFWSSDFFKANGFTTGQIYEYGLQKIEECDTFLAFVKSADASKGMQMESQRAVERNKPYILAIKNGLAFPEFRSAARNIIEYSQLPELYAMLKELK